MTRWRGRSPVADTGPGPFAHGEASQPRFVARVETVPALRRNLALERLAGVVGAIGTSIPNTSKLIKEDRERTKIIRPFPGGATPAIGENRLLPSRNRDTSSGRRKSSRTLQKTATISPKPEGQFWQTADGDGGDPRPPNWPSRSHWPGQSAAPPGPDDHGSTTRNRDHAGTATGA
jgi:hypothetical protein